MAQFALIKSQQTLEDVKSRGEEVDTVTSRSRILREENHFQETIKALLQW